MKVLGLGIMLSALAYLIFNTYNMYYLYEGYEHRGRVVWTAGLEGIFFVFVGGALYYLISRQR